MRRFLIAVLVLGALSLSGCSPRLSVHHPVPAVEITPGGDDIWNMEMDLGKTSVSCMLAVRRTETGIRAAGVTWFGMSLFDVEVRGRDISVVSCAGFLERKPLIRLLGNVLGCIFIDCGRLTSTSDTLQTSRRGGMACAVSRSDGRLQEVAVHHGLSGIEVRLTPLEK